MLFYKTRPTKSNKGLKIKHKKKKEKVAKEKTRQKSLIKRKPRSQGSMLP